MAVTVNVADASPLRLPKAMETARVPGTIPRSRNAYPAFLARATATMALSTEAMIFVRENPLAALRIYWSVNPAAKDAGDPAAAEASGLREINYIVKGYHEYKDGQKDFGRVDSKGLQRYMQMYKDEGVLKELPPIDDVYSDQFLECTNKIDAAAVRKLARDWKS
jgi:hypothetical protein